MANDDLALFPRRMIWIVMDASEWIGEDGERFGERHAVLLQVRGGLACVPLELHFLSLRREFGVRPMVNCCVELGCTFRPVVHGDHQITIHSRDCRYRLRVYPQLERRGLLLRLDADIGLPSRGVIPKRSLLRRKFFDDSNEAQNDAVRGMPVSAGSECNVSRVASSCAADVEHGDGLAQCVHEIIERPRGVDVEIDVQE
jgi:hypothetical protein